MITRLDAVDLAALASIRGMEGLTNGLLLQMHDLITNRKQDEGKDPAELSKLVKTILEAYSSNGLRSVSHLHQFATLSSALTKISTENRPSSLKEKGDVSTNCKGDIKLNQTGPTPLKENFPEKTATHKAEGMQQHIWPEEKGHKSQNLPSLQPFEHAVKDVAKALLFISLPKNLKEMGKATLPKNLTFESTSVLPVKQAFKAENNNPNLAIKSKNFHKKEAFTKNNELLTDLPSVKRSLIAEFKNAAAPVKGEPIFKEKKEIGQSLLQEQIPLNKKGNETELFSLKLSFSEQPNQQPRQIDKNVIPGAPYQAQFSTSESRRKEKRKYPHYFSDEEEGEGGQSNQDSNKGK